METTNVLGYHYYLLSGAPHDFFILVPFIHFANAWVVKAKSGVLFVKNIGINSRLYVKHI